MNKKNYLIACIVGAALICLLIGLGIYGGMSNANSGNEKHNFSTGPDKHCVFVIRDISNPISNREMTEWRNETIASVHAPADADIGWGSPYPLNESSFGRTESSKISYQSDGNTSITITPVIIAFGFSIWEENGTYITSGYTGKTGIINNASSEADRETIAGINTKALAWYNTVCRK